MTSQTSLTRRSGVASAIVRVIVAGFAVLPLLAIGETLRYWANPNAGGLDLLHFSKAIYVGVAILAAVGAIALLVGWFMRRREEGPGTLVRALAALGALGLAALAAAYLAEALGLFAPDASGDNNTGVLALGVLPIAAVYAVGAVMLFRDLRRS